MAHVTSTTCMRKITASLSPYPHWSLSVLCVQCVLQPAEKNPHCPVLFVSMVTMECDTLEILVLRIYLPMQALFP